MNRVGVRLLAGGLYREASVVSNISLVEGRALKADPGRLRLVWSKCRLKLR